MPSEVVDARKLLASLRWQADQVVTNDFGERVWLRELFDGDRRIGITDCCFVEAPCDWHSSFPPAGQTLQRRIES